MTASASLAHEHAETVLAVPSVEAGLYREETVVRVERRMPATPAPDASPTPRLKEHLTEESDFKVAAKPEPKPTRELEPEPPAKPEVKPQPRTAEKPLPRAAAEPRPAVETKLKPALKPRAKPAPQKAAHYEKPEATHDGRPAANPAVQADAARPAPSGVLDGSEGAGAGKGLAGEASGSAGDLRRQALAQILAVVEANKTYPRRARQTGQSGEVLLAVHVNGEGVVERVEVRRKHASSLLNRAASAAAKPLLGMKTVLADPLTLEIPVKFELR